MMENINQTPQERFDAVKNLQTKLQDNFLELGQLLSDIRRKGTFKLKGYANFALFIESEYNMTRSMANKLSMIYELFIEEIDIDEQTVKSIGFDRLCIIAPMVNKSGSFAEKEEWIKDAQALDVTALKEKIKEIREAEKAKHKTFKDTLIEQWIETMVTYFNCSRKELDFKLALYFQDQDLDNVKVYIKSRQRKFEEEIEGCNPI